MEWAWVGTETFFLLGLFIAYLGTGQLTGSSRRLVCVMLTSHRYFLYDRARFRNSFFPLEIRSGSSDNADNNRSHTYTNYTSSPSLHTYALLRSFFRSRIILVFRSPASAPVCLSLRHTSHPRPFNARMRSAILRGLGTHVHTHTLPSLILIGQIRLLSEG